MHQYFPEKDLNFTYQGREHQGVLDYHFGDKFLTGISWNFFEHHKKRETSTSSLDEDNRQQRMIFIPGIITGSNLSMKHGMELLE